MSRPVSQRASPEQPGHSCTFVQPWHAVIAVDITSQGLASEGRMSESLTSEGLTEEGPMSQFLRSEWLTSESLTSQGFMLGVSGLTSEVGLRAPGAVHGDWRTACTVGKPGEAGRRSDAASRRLGGEVRAR